MFRPYSWSNKASNGKKPVDKRTRPYLGPSLIHFDKIAPTQSFMIQLSRGACLSFSLAVAVFHHQLQFPSDMDMEEMYVCVNQCNPSLIL